MRKSHTVVMDCIRGVLNEHCRREMMLVDGKPFTVWWLFVTMRIRYNNKMPSKVHFLKDMLSYGRLRLVVAIDGSL